MAVGSLGNFIPVLRPDTKASGPVVPGLENRLAGIFRGVRESSCRRSHGRNVSSRQILIGSLVWL